MSKNVSLKKTLVTWQPLSPRPLSEEDAREIRQNVVGFFALLAEWDAAAERDPAADSGDPP